MVFARERKPGQWWRATLSPSLYRQTSCRKRDAIPSNWMTRLHSLGFTDVAASLLGVRPWFLRRWTGRSALVVDGGRTRQPPSSFYRQGADGANQRNVRGAVSVPFRTTRAAGIPHLPSHHHPTIAVSGGLFGLPLHTAHTHYPTHTPHPPSHPIPHTPPLPHSPFPHCAATTTSPTYSKTLFRPHATHYGSVRSFYRHSPPDMPFLARFTHAHAAYAHISSDYAACAARLYTPHTPLRCAHAAHAHTPLHAHQRPDGHS